MEPLDGLLRTDAINNAPPPELKRILVIDDDDHIRAFLRTILERAGLHVFDSSDGEEAFNLLLAHGYIDLVLVNLSMSGMSGFEFLDQMLDISEAKRPLAAVITSSPLRLDQRLQLENLGVREVLHKPFKIQGFLNAIHRLLALRSHSETATAETAKSLASPERKPRE